MIKESDFFKYYRTLNKIIPKKVILVEQMGKENIFISVTDNTFYIYDINKFNILFMGPYIDNIDSYFFYKDVLFICSSLRILLFRRGRLIREYDLSKFIEGTDQYIKRIECFGDVICVLLSDGTFMILGYKSKTNKDYNLEGEFKVEDLNIEKNNQHDLNIDYKDDTVNYEENKYYLFDEEIELIYKTDGVTYFNHPLTYVNKIIIVKEDCSMILYNFMKDKIIYKYVNSKDKLVVIEQTKTIDIVGIGYKDRISLFDIRKDKILFTFEIDLVGDVELSFSNDKMIVCTGNNMFIYDLDNKKRIIKRENVGTGKFIDDKYIIVSSDNAISIYEIVNYKLDLIKTKVINNREIRGLEFLTKNNLIVVEDHNIYSYNIFNDNLNFKFKYLDKIRQYPNPCTKIDYFDINKNIVTVENNQLYCFDFENKNSRYILNTEISLVSVYKDFCCFYSDNLYLINLKSKIVHRSIETEGIFKEPPKCMKMSNENIYISVSNEIIIFNINTNKKEVITEEHFIEDFKVYEDILGTRTERGIRLYNYRYKEFRNFRIDNVIDFTVSRDSRWIGILEDHLISIYDIISNVCIDKIPSSRKYKHIRFTSNLEFLCLVMEDNDIILLCNKSYFNPIELESNKEDYKEFNRINQLEIIKYNKIENKLYNEILLVKEYERKMKSSETTVEKTMEDLNINESSKQDSLSHKVIDMLLDDIFINSLTEEETLKILHLLLPYLKECFEVVQRIINKILKLKISILKEEDLEGFYIKFKTVYDDYENDYIRLVGYLTLENNKLL